MNAIGLVVVDRGCARTFAPLHVDLRLVDLDDIRRGDFPPVLPTGIGFEELATRAGVSGSVRWEMCEACSGLGFLLVERNKDTEVIERCDACGRYDSDAEAVEACYEIAARGGARG